MTQPVKQDRFNKCVAWAAEKLLRRSKNYKELSFEFTRGYYDGEQIWQSFVTQYFTELRELVDQMEAEALAVEEGSDHDATSKAR